jgi:hypothetical protein
MPRGLLVPVSRLNEYEQMPAFYKIYDAHGQPIEQRALFDVEGADHPLSIVEFKQAYAEHYIDVSSFSKAQVTAMLVEEVLEIVRQGILNNFIARFGDTLEGQLQESLKRLFQELNYTHFNRLQITSLKIGENLLAHSLRACGLGMAFYLSRGPENQWPQNKLTLFGTGLLLHDIGRCGFEDDLPMPELVGAESAGVYRHTDLGGLVLARERLPEEVVYMARHHHGLFAAVKRLHSTNWSFDRCLFFNELGKIPIIFSELYGRLPEVAAGQGTIERDQVATILETMGRAVNIRINKNLFNVFSSMFAH